jgi:UDP-N-acetylmuramate--alanine ligase
VIKGGLRTLGGLERRFQIKGETGGVLILDDYGHHPSEIIATLKTAKESWPERRLIVVFQPHRFSRTQALYDRFVLSFNEADVLVVTDIYSAGERPIGGVAAQDLAGGIKAHGHKEVHYCAHHEGVLSTLLAVVRPGDVLLTLGAGDVYRIGDAFLKRYPGEGGSSLEFP